MTDRELDALFAEKVLGLKPCTCAAPLTDRSSVDRSIQVCDTCGGDRIGAYTSSLDAAWEALSKSGRFCCRRMQIYSDYDYIHEATVVLAEEEDGHIEHRARSETHPARALVLACLKAVGVEVEAEE